MQIMKHIHLTKKEKKTARLTATGMWDDNQYGYSAIKH